MVVNLPKLSQLKLQAAVMENQIPHLNSLDENITTDKHKPGKASPKKPVDTTVINLDVRVPERPSGSIVLSSENHLETTSSPEDRESNLLKEDLEGHHTGSSENNFLGGHLKRKWKKNIQHSRYPCRTWLGIWGAPRDRYTYRKAWRSCAWLWWEYVSHSKRTHGASGTPRWACEYN